MTVISTTYASIEEAWGGDISRPPKKDKKLRKAPPEEQVASVCDMYQSKISGASGDGNSSVYGRHDKTNYQRGIQPQPFTIEHATDMQREPTVKHIEVGRHVQSEERPPFSKQFEANLPPLYEDDINDIPPATLRGRVHEGLYQQQPPPPPAVYTEHRYTNDNRFNLDDIDTDFVADEQRYRPVRSSSPTAAGYPPSRGRGPSLRGSVSPWIDALLFIASGVLLIFLLDQFVKIGMYLQQLKHF